MSIEHLKEITTCYIDKNSENTSIIPGLSLFRKSAVSTFEAVVYEPLICLILQGSKETSIGTQYANLRPGDALLVSHDLPVVSRVTKGTEQTPYLALILSLDLSEVRNLYAQLADDPELYTVTSPLSKAVADPAWLDPLVRYVELANNTRDALVLGPSILREIHYRLLLSPIGRTLRSLLLSDSHASRIALSIQKLRAEFRTKITVFDLASSAGMSVSSFHKHFKTVTGVTPLQYQKDLRLIEARALLVDKGRSVSEVAYSIGYESPTHFSRDYRRKFGLAPSRDASA